MNNSQQQEASFYKEQFLASKQRPGFERDILSVVLEDKKMYTMAEADQLIDQYMNRKVK